MLMLIDTHAHLNFDAYNKDREEVIARCFESGMAVINVGSQFNTSKLAVELAHMRDNFYAAIGLHPIHVFEEQFEVEEYRKLLSLKVVAIGETGLDFFHTAFYGDKAGNFSFEEAAIKQKEVFIKHIELATIAGLALALHGRNGKEGEDVYEEMLEILEKYKIERAVFHCYGGDLKTARKIIAAGYYFGIGGPITFNKKSEELKAIVKEIPVENLLLETDAPYLTPEPHRGERNEPLYVELVAEKVAELKGLPKEEVIEQTWQNAKKLFKI